MPFIQLPFLEQTSPPPFYRAELSDDERKRLDRWFVGERSQAYYLKRFAQFDHRGQLYPRWHWAAFFATFGWLLYRKRYLDCFVYLVAGLSFIKLNIVLVLALAEFVFVAQLPSAWQLPIRLVIAGLVWLFWAAMVARWSDAYYYRMARREIADALDLYPDDLESQRRHLKHHGGVSWLGLLVAYGLFAMVVAIFGLQFVPLISLQKQQALINESIVSTNHVRIGVNKSYRATECPLGDVPKPLYAKGLNFWVTDDPMGFDADCLLIAQVHGMRYPIRYLNGRRMIWYHSPKTDQWHCVNNLNKQNQFTRCQ